EGNPTGGNMFRGLYNIVLKSLGAAMKRHPDVRLDYVIDYGERMLRPGYYFMNSPGNDLESIAGQVAAGANMIFFITGNGSITNFPFVPTLKVVTTSQRFNMLERDMDVNAGAYQDGTPMDELGKGMFDLTVAAASGVRTKGEKAGHAQVSLWRDWRQTDAVNLQRLQEAPQPQGVPLMAAGASTGPARTFQAVRTAGGVATDQIGLLLPTSLCSSQIARLIANRLNATFNDNRGVSRFVALPHTEGCGVSSGHSEAMYARTTMGYLTHPLVRFGLLLEHGCEKTHNDYMANQLSQRGVDRERFGWASVQIDGGIKPVTEKVEAWFGKALGGLAVPERADAGLGALRLGLLDDGKVPESAAEQFASLTAAVVSAGGTVVLPATAALLSSPAYLDNLESGLNVQISLAYGQTATPGLHVMETPTRHWVETVTGLGATGVEIMLAHVSGSPVQAHPMIPLLQVTSDEAEEWSADTDLTMRGDEPWTETILPLVLSVASRAYVPKLFEQGNTDFQVSRGLLGISM
ncbi:MAG: UxaA family hydrolase, partial [Candidatus Tectomicrobia bacterium]|nr:UxaA family hydrolase [Candidatus Tectomicrobia bacterium]